MKYNLLKQSMVLGNGKLLVTISFDLLNKYEIFVRNGYSAYSNIGESVSAYSSNKIVLIT